MGSYTVGFPHLSSWTRLNLTTEVDTCNDPESAKPIIFSQKTQAFTMGLTTEKTKTKNFGH